MFPFGDEEKRLVTQHLQRVNRTYPVNKTMFLFLIIKEEYLKAEREGLEPVQCAERARVRSCKQHVLPRARNKAACAAAGRASVPFFLRNA